MKNSITKQNTFKRLAISPNGKLIDISMEEQVSIDALREHWSAQLRKVQLRNMSEPDYQGKYDLSQDKERRLDNLYLLKEMEVYRRARREKKHTLIFFSIAMALLLTALYFIIQAQQA